MTSQGESRPRIAPELPESFWRLLAPTPEAVAKRLRELVAIELFREGKISGGKAGELLGIGKAGFMDLLAAHRVPYMDLSPEEVEEDFLASRAHSEAIRAAPPPPTAAP